MWSSDFIIVLGNISGNPTNIDGEDGVMRLPDGCFHVSHCKADFRQMTQRQSIDASKPIPGIKARIEFTWKLVPERNFFALQSTN
jgi:hypothetical protein